jgi:cytochrome c-type biogenesis protein
MGWSEAVGQVLQTRPVLAYDASYLGGVVATASPCILASIPLVIGFVGGYAGAAKSRDHSHRSGCPKDHFSTA